MWTTQNINFQKFKCIKFFLGFRRQLLHHSYATVWRFAWKKPWYSHVQTRSPYVACFILQFIFKEKLLRIQYVMLVVVAWKFQWYLFLFHLSLKIMEPANIEICKLCMRCMIDPRILPCSDSFCLKCLESSEISKNSSKCPVCQIPFKLPKGGLKELKKNEFINCLSDLKHNHNVCDGCKKNQAINFCVDCSFNYCSTCLEHHGRFPTTSNHQLRPISSKVKEINVNKYSTCKEHSKEKCLLCLDCKIALCDHCSSLKHKNHKIKPTSEHFESVRIKFEQSLKSKKGILKNVCLNLKSVEDKIMIMD